MKADALTVLLNKLVAICKSGAGTYAELARSLGKRPQQINEWLLQRAHEPSGRITMAMQTWASDKTLVIAAGTAQQQIEYRREYRAVCRRFPLSGAK